VFGWGLLLVHIMVLGALYIVQGPIIAGAGSMMLTVIITLIANQIGAIIPLTTIIIALSISGAAIGLSIASGTRGD